MIILEKPYVSEFLQQTVVRLQIPVLATDFARSLPASPDMNLLEAGRFFALLERSANPLLYSNSENSAELLNRYCPEHHITKTVNYLKDKSRLRKVFSKLNPEMWHQTFSLEELSRIDFSILKMPCVVKPVRGFASIGIHAITNEKEWKAALEAINREVRIMKDVFPEVVVSLNEFMVEKYIEGTEIAIDAYFDGSGQPVILNILTHLFGSESDMSDRLYLTSAGIIRKYHGPVSEYLEQVSALTGLINFPFHLEMRQEKDGGFVPIEINPMRFMGFCVADVEFYFYGINPYEFFFHRKKPDWDRILESRENKLFGMFGIDLPKHLDKQKVLFNYEKFIGHFSNPLFHVKMDYRRFPMAIYLFAETWKENFREFEDILYSDLSEFITLSKTG